MPISFCRRTGAVTWALTRGMSLGTALPALILGVLAARMAPADIITIYTDRTAWAAAVSGIQNIDFTTLGASTTGDPATRYIPYATGAGLTIDTVNFRNTASSSINVLSQTYCCGTFERGYDALASNDDGTGILVTLPSHVTAVGMSLYGTENSDGVGASTETVDLLVNGKSFSVTTPTAPSAAFWGFVDSSAVSSFTITPVQNPNLVAAEIMNFSFGQTATTTPEPRYGWAVTVLGVLVLARSRKVPSPPNVP